MDHSGASASIKSSGRPNKISPSLDWHIKQKFKKDLSLTSNIMKTNTDAKCSSRTIRWHLNKKGFKNVKQMQRPHLLPRHKTSHLQFATDYQTWDVDKWKKMLFLDEKKFSLDGADGFPRYWHAKDVSPPKEIFSKHDTVEVDQLLSRVLILGQWNS